MGFKFDNQNEWILFPGKEKKKKDEYELKNNQIHSTFLSNQSWVIQCMTVCRILI